MKKSDMEMFLKYLQKASVYFEYGSGGSTYQALFMPNIKKVISIESDIDWIRKVEKSCKTLPETDDRLRFVHIDFGKAKKWGYPGKSCTVQQRINYSNQFQKLTHEERKSIDFILIDGRFRVACCLKCFQDISDDCLIAFDDFLDRPEYHIVLQFFMIVDKTSDNKMVILKKRNNVTNPHADIIKKYELLAR